MVDANLDILRADTIQKRISGAPGGLRVLWRSGDIARIRQRVFDLPQRELIGAAEVKFDSQRSVLLSGVAPMLRRATDSTALAWQFRISNESPDLMGDVIKLRGWDLQNFAKNGPVLFAHDANALPVGQSSLPEIVGDALVASVEFPKAGVSEVSDQVRAMVAAGILRAASVGFQPGKFKFSTDRARGPMAIDFEDGHILVEWSLVPVPANPGCLVIGPIGAKSASGRSSRNAPVDDDIDNEDTKDWQCLGSESLPLDSSDDIFDPIAAKNALIKQSSSPDGTILDTAASYFLASDVTQPLAASSYLFPFCNVGDAGVVASKTGWRSSLAEMEKSDIPGLPLADARSLCDQLEARLGDVKMAEMEARRREGRELASKARSLAASIGDDPPLARDQRMVEARAFSRAARAANRD
jgi:hypothetical protein